MKYMIMAFGDHTRLADKSPEWMAQMIDFMQRIDVELAQSGELVFQQGLADPAVAKTITVQDTAPVASDGPVTPPSESLAGWWVVDVRDEARAFEIASRISQAGDAPVEVRQCLDAPPDNGAAQGNG